MRLPSRTQKIIIVGVILLLCILAIEMLDGTSDIHWTLFDFLLAFALLAAAGLTIEAVIRKIKSPINRRISIAFIVLLLVLLWAELAVGVFNTPLAGD